MIGTFFFFFNDWYLIITTMTIKRVNLILEAVSVWPAERYISVPINTGVLFRVYRNLKNIYCGVKELSNPGLLHTKPKTHAKEEETPEDEQRESKFPRDIAEDNPVLGQPRS